MEQKGRDLGYAVPVGGALGTTATDFCGAVSQGSEVVRRSSQTVPDASSSSSRCSALLVVAVLRRTTWRPVTPLRVARRREGGQLIRAAARICVALAVVHRDRVPHGAGLPPRRRTRGLVVSGPDVAGLSEGGEAGGARVILVALVGFLVIGTSILLVLAATTSALGEIDRGWTSTYDARTVSPGPLEGAARRVRRRVHPGGRPQRDRRPLPGRACRDPAVRRLRAGDRLRGCRGPRLAPSRCRTGAAAGPQDGGPPGRLDPPRGGGRTRPGHGPHPRHREPRWRWPTPSRGSPSS